jgi:hypothetical protein
MLIEVYTVAIEVWRCDEYIRIDGEGRDGT